MGRDLATGVIVQRLAAREPSTYDGLVFERSAEGVAPGKVTAEAFGVRAMPRETLSSANQFSAFRGFLASSSSPCSSVNIDVGRAFSN